MSRKTCCVILTLSSLANPHHNITFRSYHKAAENVIDQVRPWVGSNHGSPDLQAHALVVKLSRFYIYKKEGGYAL